MEKEDFGSGTGKKKLARIESAKIKVG